jgi:tetratricopeptide (TPR) repeat protein
MNDTDDYLARYSGNQESCRDYHDGNDQNNNTDDSNLKYDDGHQSNEYDESYQQRNYSDSRSSNVTGVIEQDSSYLSGDGTYEDSNATNSNPLHAEEALMDLAKLEELQEEAERIKTIGNKHMASQEYMQAYNCYSAALQISPVGPSSHVFLSNRAAALLSLKKYASAATDARRAIALAPSFGKAHARLGQALYFLKDFDGAVCAYEDALSYEPNNDVTITYLEKAKTKLEKQKQKKSRKSSGSASAIEDASNSSTMAETTTQFSAHRSIATDTFNKHSIVQRDNYGGHDIANNTVALQNAIAATTTSTPSTDARVRRSSGAVNEYLKSNEQKQKQNSPQIGIPNSAVSVAASAITTESGEQRKTKTTTSSSDATAKMISNQDMVSTVAIDDPEFDEAIKIQQRANKYLVQKQYRAAIEEFTAALFLVPDDPILSPELHLGRAHALNGSRRHESAKNDANLAVKLNPTPAAYSTLAKSFFYMKNYKASVDAFEMCIQLLPPGETLGLFDRAYLEKAEKALAEDESEGKLRSPAKQQSTVVPKLPPPRFVPREEAIQSQPQPLRPMPKEWPQQQASSRKQVPLKCGTEREIVFLSESLGVKLNRGWDGIVRVVSVTPTSGGSVVVRQGDIQPGDVVREAAGVDIRLPITNIMWGDTVALIKMAPRPISFLVAKEISPVPPDVLNDTRYQEDQYRAQQGESVPKRAMMRPSNASGDEAVSSLVESKLTPNEDDLDEEIMEVKDVITYDIIEVENGCDFAPIDDTALSLKNTTQPTPTSLQMPLKPHDSALQTSSTESITTFTNNVVDNVSGDIRSETNEEHATHQHDEVSGKNETATSIHKNQIDPTKSSQANNVASNESLFSAMALDSHPGSSTGDGLDEGDIVEVEHTTASSKIVPAPIIDPNASEELHREEERILGGEILFSTNNPVEYGEWDTLKWMSYSGTRIVSSCQEVHRQYDGDKKRSLIPTFWKTGGKRYESRALAIYDKPSLIMVLRRPTSVEEVHALLGLPDIAQDPGMTTEKYWILESAIDPAFAKLRLSPLTTMTSLAQENEDDRDKSCFQMFTPFETIVLSPVHVRGDSHQSFRDSGAYLETLAVETSLSKMLFASHGRDIERSLPQCIDIAWKHQIVIGSLHSIVVSGNVKSLLDSLDFVRNAVSNSTDKLPNSHHLPARIIDVLDDAGFTALYYACKNKMHISAQHLIQSGANVSIKVGSGKETLFHVAARNLDDKMINILLSSDASIADVNELNDEYKTPIYVAATEGSVIDNGRDPSALGRCITSLQGRGGRSTVYGTTKVNRHPVSILSSLLLPEYLSAAMEAFPHRYPLKSIDVRIIDARGLSLSALYHYPIHFAIFAMRKNVPNHSTEDDLLPESRLLRCLRILVERGFEPNERLECTQASMIGSEELNHFYGFAPMQLLAFVALELDSKKGKIDTISYDKKCKLVSDAAEFLVRNGARVTLEPPQQKRPRKKFGSTEPTQTVDILPIKLESDKHVMNLLGGEKRLKKAREIWIGSKKVEMSERVDLLDNTTTLSDLDTPGGNDSLSCAICWIEFGTILNRRHKCRVTGRFVCDDCSSKRIQVDGSDHRISDGQYLFFKVKSCRTINNIPGTMTNTTSSRATQTSVNAMLEKLENEEKANRDSLFGGLVDKATNYIMGEDEDVNTVSKLNGLTNTLDQTRDALNQRGDRLASLGEKSTQLVDASADFAKMAKELNQQNDRGFFGW